MRYPIGIQTFSELRENGYVYIDKTGLIYRLVHSDAKYFFLSRPRRFGKSLLTSTFRSYFEGHRDLFKGLAIDSLEKEWTAYPVLHFDMSQGKHLAPETLNRYLSSQLMPYEEKYDVNTDVQDANIRLSNLIKQVSRQTGQKAVVLIDEYDAPLLDVVHKDGELEALRNIMRNFYSPLKASDPYLRFVFLTGITKFSQLSIFSELNNINNISMDQPYAALCGITEEEMRTQLQPGIQRLADKEAISYDAALQKLKDNYDGYHFTWPSPDIYNPFSLLNAMAKCETKSYWFGSGTPTYLIEMMKKFHYPPTELGGECEARAEDFDAPTNQLSNIIPLLYQSGYLTIKAYDKMFEAYTLGIPNREVRLGLMKSLIPYYLTPETRLTSSAVINISRALYKDDMQAALCILQKFLASVPYTDNTRYEGHWQQVIYIIFSLIGEFVDVEVRTPRGRVDIVMRTPVRIYLMELKLNRDADTAIRQMELKDYPSRFTHYRLPITKVGINFDSEKHTISDWKIG